MSARLAAARAGGACAARNQPRLTPAQSGRRWFDLVLVLQTDNSVLWERLEKRGYSSKKVQENVQCEIMHVIVEEARESYAEAVVHCVPSNTAEEMEQNVENLVNWAAAWKPAVQ